MCEEHCPTPRKAIILKQKTIELPEGKTAVVRRPYVDESLCIGCGICGTKCPVTGESAIIITSENEQRWEE